MNGKLKVHPEKEVWIGPNRTKSLNQCFVRTDAFFIAQTNIIVISYIIYYIEFGNANLMET